MKIVFLFLSFIICFSSLLDQVRKDIISKALLYLPKREEIDILKLGIEMSKAKEEYSMTDEESAYFIYKWIAQNIATDCIGIMLGNSSGEAVTTYREGKGGPIGISGLFNTLCSLLNVESNTILGLTKIATLNYTQLIQFKNYAWNYILIGNKYYLIDASMGGGYCGEKSFNKKQSDFYFGTNPEAFIRLHFPNDNKWQLLSETITKDKFESMAYLYEEFFTLGFKEISPDIQKLKKLEDITIRLTTYNSIDDFFEDYELTDIAEHEGEMPEIGFFISVNKISNGVYEFDYTAYDSGRYDVYVENKETGKSYHLMTFEAYK